MDEMFFCFLVLLYQNVFKLIRVCAHTCERFASFARYAFASAVSNITDEGSTVSQSVPVVI